MDSFKNKLTTAEEIRTKRNYSVYKGDKEMENTMKIT